MYTRRAISYKWGWRQAIMNIFGILIGNSEVVCRSYDKKRIMGFGNYVTSFKGPRLVRIKKKTAFFLFPSHEKDY